MTGYLCDMTAPSRLRQRGRCEHPDDGCGYVGGHARAELRMKLGQRQVRCRRCKLWRWPLAWTAAMQRKLERREDALARHSNAWLTRNRDRLRAAGVAVG